MPDSERLRRWIAMMELERSHEPVVAAESACSPGLLHQDLLDLAPSPRNTFASTPTAPVSPASLQPEFAQPMAVAFHHRDGYPGIPCSLAVGFADAATSPQSVLPQPVLDGRFAETGPDGDLRERESIVDQR